MSSVAREEKRGAPPKPYGDSHGPLFLDFGLSPILCPKRRQKRQIQGQAQHKAQQRYKDPTERLRRLQEVVEHRPQLRPEDIQRHPLKGPEIELHRGALQGPPSREAAMPEAIATSGLGGLRHARAASTATVAGREGRSAARLPHPLTLRREVSSADAALPTSPLFLGGHKALNGPSTAFRSNSFESLSAAWPPQQQQGAAIPSSRPPGGLLPPLSPQQGGTGLQRYATSLNGDYSDLLSVHSAITLDGASASSGQLLRPRGGDGQQVMRAGRGAERPLVLTASASGGRFVLPAMPGAPCVNRWVLSEEGETMAGITHGRALNVGWEGSKKKFGA